MDEEYIHDNKRKGSNHLINDTEIQLTFVGSDIVVPNKTNNKVLVIDVACRNNNALLDKHQEK